METKHFQLEARDNSRVTKAFQIILGILCILIAVFWIIFKFKTLTGDNTLWITIVFLTGFGIYEILAGLGKTEKYIEISSQSIILKQNPLLPQIEIKAPDTQKIEIFPLSIAITAKDSNRHILRFGLSYSEIIIPVKDAVTEYAQINSIMLDIKQEDI